MVSNERQNWNMSSTTKNVVNQRLYDQTVLSNRSKSLSRYDESRCKLPIQQALDRIKNQVRDSS